MDSHVELKADLRHQEGKNLLANLTEYSRLLLGWFGWQNDNLLWFGTRRSDKRSDQLS